MSHGTIQRYIKHVEHLLACTTDPKERERLLGILVGLRMRG